jgi:SAM-dependent methyltransferase
MAHAPLQELRGTYDRVAPHYARQFLGELAHKPLDRALLDHFAEICRGRGTTYDVGCGPGHVGRYLADRGVVVEGLDLSPASIAVARAAHPAMTFHVADFCAVDLADGTLGGITAFYAIVHLPPDVVSRAIREFARLLAPGGHLLLAFHVGDQRVHLDEWLGERVSVDFWFHDQAAIERHVVDAGLTLEATTIRAPYPAEHPTRRAYVLAAKT